MSDEYKWQPKKYLIRISIYLLSLLIIFTYLFLFIPDFLLKGCSNLLTLSGCIFIGGIGGCTYCLRAIYLQACVKKQWDENWVVWYILRPILSLITGGLSYLFIKAGLVLFSSSEQYEINQFSIWALAFLSGLNVDNFMKKIESIGQTVWGITPSRVSNTKNKGENNE